MAKIGAQTMHELFIQKKESPEAQKGEDQDGEPRHREFLSFTLQDVAESFE